MFLFDLLDAFEQGWHAGELIEPVVTPVLDELQLGSSHAGEEYLHFINEHNFDPIHPLDGFHAHEAETAQHNHDADTPSSHHDDNSCHYDFHDDNY
jgi:hypothetical protein